MRRIGALIATVAVLAACTRGSSAGPDLTVLLEQIATLERPLAMATRPGDPALYVAEQTGLVVAIDDDQPGSRTVLDLTHETVASGEQGLLGIAFAPDGGRLYVDYTDRQGDTRVVAYAMGGRGADPSTARQILFVDQPYANHNGGNLVFGPDGHLYIGLGDGGGAGDPQGNGQALDALLGKILRIDPTRSGRRPYTVPASNPFVGRAGTRPEIWAYGLRNPWRFSFDRATDDLWIGDVGQSSREEIDHQPASSPGGENYGWSAYEGTLPYSAQPVAEAVSPVYEYDHGGGRCAVTGGYVYRGASIPSLQGAYVFADACGGALEWLRLAEDGSVTHGMLGPTVPALASFGEDRHGELYALSLEGPVYRLVP